MFNQITMKWLDFKSAFRTLDGMPSLPKHMFIEIEKNNFPFLTFNLDKSNPKIIYEWNLNGDILRESISIPSILHLNYEQKIRKEEFDFFMDNWVKLKNAEVEKVTNGTITDMYSSYKKENLIP